LPLAQLVFDDDVEVFAEVADFDFEELDFGVIDEQALALLLVLEHGEFFHEGLDFGSLLARAHVFEDVADRLGRFFAFVVDVVDFVLFVVFFGLFFGFFGLFLLEYFLVVLAQLVLMRVETFVAQEGLEGLLCGVRVELLELGKLLVFPLGDVGLGLLDFAVDACEPSPDGGVFGDFLELVGVFVHDGVGAVHEGRDLDELLDPLVDEPEDGVVLRVGALELEVEAQLEVLDVDVDEEERGLGLLLARRLGLEVLVHDLEVVQHGVGDAVGDALVDEEDLLFPLA